MDKFDKILSSIIGLSILAVIVSRNAQTSGVIQSLASGFSNIMSVVVAPITAAAQTSAASGTGAGASASTASAPQAAAVSATNGGSSLMSAALESATGQSFGTGANALDIVSTLNAFANGN